MANKVQIAAKLYDMRDTAKRFFRADYKSKLEPYTALLQAHMKQSGKGELESVMALLQLESVQDNGMAQLLFISAAVELIEPSKN